MTSAEYAASIRARIDDARTHGVLWYDPSFDYRPDRGTAHLNVLAPDGSAVAITSTINLLSVSQLSWAQRLQPAKSGPAIMSK